MLKAVAVGLSLVLVSPCARAAAVLTSDVSVSSMSAKGKRSEAGRGGGISEGKPLEMTIWGGSGAVIGSLAGPVGTIIGAASGALVGLLISIFVVPHNGPDLAAKNPGGSDP